MIKEELQGKQTITNQTKNKTIMDNNRVEEAGYYYPLFKFLNEQHNLILLDSEIQEIIHEVNNFQGAASLPTNSMPATPPATEEKTIKQVLQDANNWFKAKEKQEGRTAEDILKKHLLKYYRKSFPETISDDELYERVRVFKEEEPAILAAMEEYRTQPEESKSVQKK